MRRLILVLGTILFLSCISCGLYNREAPAPNPDKPTDSDMCSKAEETLRRLDCFAALGVNNDGKVYDPETDKDIPFAEFCRRVQNVGARLNPTCLSTLASCAELDRCVQ